MANREPRIITDWTTIPPDVMADGELVSLRVLAKEHEDAMAMVEKLKAELFEKYHQEASAQGADADGAKEYANKRIALLTKE